MASYDNFGKLTRRQKMDDIQDWLRRIDTEAWQRRIRQLRQELRGEEESVTTTISFTLAEDSSPIERRGKSQTARLPKNRVLGGKEK